MNMSYCRYENTLTDLRDCLDDAAEHRDFEATNPVSEREVRAFMAMVKEMFEFLEDSSLIDFDNRCLDEESLDELCDRMMTMRKCIWCDEDGCCELRSGVADDDSCGGSVDEMRECNYLNSRI